MVAGDWFWQKGWGNFVLDYFGDYVKSIQMVSKNGTKIVHKGKLNKGIAKGLYKKIRFDRF